MSQQKTNEAKYQPTIDSQQRLLTKAFSHILATTTTSSYVLVQDVR